ncbi:translation initiation factor IF-2 [Triticum aestivum]|uniref:translation initiation factor IF-2 n=1 Tax=Triticum aestivum TaxID=4565 RepID=UPI001D02AA20|nr:translation initiation factor IF-2-like [Triticum aestivum]
MPWPPLDRNHSLAIDRGGDRFRPRVEHVLFPFPFLLVSILGKPTRPPHLILSPAPRLPTLPCRFPSSPAAPSSRQPTIPGASPPYSALPLPLLAGGSSLAAATNTARRRGRTSAGKVSGEYGEAPQPHEPPQGQRRIGRGAAAARAAARSAYGEAPRPHGRQGPRRSGRTAAAISRGGSGQYGEAVFVRRPYVLMLGLDLPLCIPTGITKLPSRVRVGSEDVPSVASEHSAKEGHCEFTRLRQVYTGNRPSLQ